MFEKYIQIVECARSPDVDEMFDVREIYQHVAKWNDDYQHECNHSFWQNDFYVGEGMSCEGLGLEMQNWGDEAAKRVLSSVGFVLVDFVEFFDVDGDESDATLLWKRYVWVMCCTV